jgi:hypothetical protein
MPKPGGPTPAPSGRRRPGHRLNPTDSGGDAGFHDDLEQADVPGHAGMGAAAQFFAELADAHHPHLVTVLLAEQGGGAFGDCLLASESAVATGVLLADLRIDQLLDGTDSAWVSGEKWVKSKRRRL